MSKVSRRISKIQMHGCVKTQRKKATSWQCQRQKLPNFKQIHPEMPTNCPMLDTLEVLHQEATCHVLGCNLANALSIANHGHGNMHVIMDYSCLASPSRRHITYTISSDSFSFRTTIIPAYFPLYFTLYILRILHAVYFCCTRVESSRL